MTARESSARGRGRVSLHDQSRDRVHDELGDHVHDHVHVHDEPSWALTDDGAWSGTTDLAGDPGAHGPSRDDLRHDETRYDETRYDETRYDEFRHDDLDHDRAPDDLPHGDRWSDPWAAETIDDVGPGHHRADQGPLEHPGTPPLDDDTRGDPPAPSPWSRLLGPASVSVVSVLQLVLATAVAVVITDRLGPTAKAGIVLGLGVLVVLAAWPVGDRRAAVALGDLGGFVLRRVATAWARRRDDVAPAPVPPLVVGRAAGPHGPEMGVVHDGAGWVAIASVARRGPQDGSDDPASWLPETVDALVRDASLDQRVQVLLEQEGHAVDTLVAVRVDPGSSPAGGLLGDVAGVPPLLRHRLRRVDEALEPTGLALRPLDPAEVVGQLTRAFALDDPDPDADTADDGAATRLGEHRSCVVSGRGVEQTVTMRPGAGPADDAACELESFALRLPGRVTLSLAIGPDRTLTQALLRVGAAPGTNPAALAAATRRAVPPGADLLVSWWRQGPRYASTLPLGR